MAYRKVPLEQSFAYNCPDMMEYWDYEKNDKLGIDPREISLGSSRKIWFFCQSCKVSIFLTLNDVHSRKSTRCRKCYYKRRTTTSLLEFIKEAKVVHNNKYDYSKVKYINSRTKICIICPIHGEFFQTPAGHLHCGCRLCGSENSRKTRTATIQQLIKRAEEIHGNKYDYSKIKEYHYKNKVKIICPVHGEFEQLMWSHLQGVGCKKCSDSISGAISGENRHKKKMYSISRGSKGYMIINIPNTEASLYVVNKKSSSRYATRIGQHLYIMAKHLGRPIDTRIESVHHKNGNRSDNRIKNLELRKKGHGAGHTEQEALVSDAYKVLEQFDKLPKRVINQLKKKLEGV